MAEHEVNDHGVPQYGRGHAGRMLVALAAIDHLKRPTAVSVSALTGLSQSKVDAYVAALHDELGVKIVKEAAVYRIESWGVLVKRSGVKHCLTTLIRDLVDKPE